MEPNYMILKIILLVVIHQNLDPSHQNQNQKAVVKVTIVKFLYQRWYPYKAIKVIILWKGECVPLYYAWMSTIRIYKMMVKIFKL